MQKLNVLGEMLSPWGRPRSSKKFLEMLPLSSSTQAVLLVPMRDSHFLKFSPKLKNFSTSPKKELERVSNALAMSTASTAPLILLCLQWAMDSQTLMSTSCAYLVLLNPFCDRLHIRLIILSRRAFSALEIILYIFDNREIGRQFFMEDKPLFFGISLILAPLKLGVREPELKQKRAYLSRGLLR